MNTFDRASVAIFVSLVLGACSSVPTTTTLLEQTRIEYRMAQSNPSISNYASMEMKQAGDAMAQANASADKNESLDKIDRLAHVAKQKIALAQEVANQRAAEADVTNAARERDQVRLEQRTQEADRAKSNAENERRTAALAMEDAARAQQEKTTAQLAAKDAQAHAANLQAQLNALAAKQTERGYVIIMNDVLFGTDQSRLTIDGMHTAQQIADILRDNPERTVLIEGFTDSTGSAAHNQVLSEKRASTVAQTLQELGVARTRISTRGYGASYPVASNATAQQRQLNRRVEIVLSDERGQIVPR